MPNNGVTINDLNSVSSITANDEIPVWDAEESGEPTKKITGDDLAASIKSLGSLLGTSDVVNNLTSTSTNTPLSAAQGKVLNLKIQYQNIGSTDMLSAIASALSDGQMCYFRTTGTTTNGPRSGIYLIGTAVRAGNNITITASEMTHPETIYQNSTNNAGSTWFGWSGIGCAVFDSATPSTVYSTLSSIGIGKSMPFIITNSDAASFLTGGKSTSLLKGIVARTGATGNLYDFLSGAGANQYMYTWRVTATSASDITPGTVYRYTGTAI